MNLDDQAFLNQIEQNIRSKDNEKESARQEADQRAREMERIRAATAKVPVSKPAGKQSPAASTKVSDNALQNDPRYKEYFERLKKQKGIQPGAEAPDEPKTEAPKTEKNAVGPGTIVRFDDGSIGVYKDAVSGRDYALFYFLEPGNQFIPQGVFLQCYQAKVIGQLPENYFAQLRDSSEWNRDMILYHLNKFDHAGFLDSIAEHEQRKPRIATPSKNATVAEPTGKPSEPHTTPKPDIAEVKQDTVGDKTKSGENISKQSTEPGLVKGREFKIRFGGKMWQAVYWLQDEQGAIVAHNTHGHWSLMRLDLTRFEDSLELGDIVDAQTMGEIAESAAAS